MGDDTENENKETWHADDVVRGFLGWFVIPASLLALAAVWVATADAERADGMSRWLQAIIIAVLGFYFGNADAAWARRRAREAQAEVAEVEGMVATQILMAASLQEQLVDAHVLIEELRKVRLQAKIEEPGGDTR